MLLADTKQNVIDILNASNLPIDAIYYVMKEVMFEVEQTYNRILQQEKEALKNAQKDANDGKKRPTTKEDAFKLNNKYEEEQKQIDNAATQGILNEVNDIEPAAANED